MEVHVLYILKSSGECLYSRIFTPQYKELEIDLITSFFSAFFTFSKEVLSEDIDILEMGRFKFLFQKREGFIFSLHADKTISNLYLNNCLEKIIEIFFFGIKEKGWKDYEVIDDYKMDAVIDEILYGGGNILKKVDLYKKIDEYFFDSIKRKDIMGAALLTNTGEIIHTSLPEQILVRSIKELEIRFMSGTTWIPELFYTLENGQKVFSRQVGQDKKDLAFIIVLLFDPLVPLGMAELTSQRIAQDLATQL